jgi:tetratricopeptide (TPR) repeat protein
LHLAVYPFQALNYVSLWGTQLSQESHALDKAYDAAQDAVTLNNTFPSAHMALGTVYLWQKQYDDAIAEFERAVALDESFVCGHMLLAFGVGRLHKKCRFIVMVQGESRLSSSWVGQAGDALSGRRK